MANRIQKKKYTKMGVYIGVITSLIFILWLVWNSPSTKVEDLVDENIQAQVEEQLGVRIDQGSLKFGGLKYYPINRFYTRYKRQIIFRVNNQIIIAECDTNGCTYNRSQ